MPRSLLHLCVIQGSDYRGRAGRVRRPNRFYTKAGQYLTLPTQDRAISGHASDIALQRNCRSLVPPLSDERLNAELLKRSLRRPEPAEHRDQVVIGTVRLILIVDDPDSQSRGRLIELEDLRETGRFELKSKVRRMVDCYCLRNGKAFPSCECDEFALLLGCRIALRIAERSLYNGLDS